MSNESPHSASRRASDKNPDSGIPSLSEREDEQQQEERLDAWKAKLAQQTQDPDARQKREGLVRARKEYRRGQRRPRRRTVALGKYEPPAKCSGDYVPPAPETLNMRIEMTRRVQEGVQDNLRSNGLGADISTLIRSLLTQRTANDRKVDPKLFNYEAFAEYLSHNMAAGHMWTEEQARYLIFVTGGWSYVHMWIEILGEWRAELAELGRDPEKLLVRLNQLKLELRKNKSWTNWDAILDEIHDYFA